MAENAGTIFADVRVKLSKLEADLKNVNSKLNTFSAQSKQRASGFEKAWTAAFTAIGFLGARAITKLLAGIKNGVAVFAGFQQSIANVVSVTKAFGESQREITEAAREAGETTRFSARQAADALFFLASAGLDARQSIDALDGVLKLAGATQSDLASTASTVTAVLSQFNLQAAESERVSNVFAAAIANSQANMQKLTGAFRQVGPVAAGLGLSLEETTGALQLLFNAGFQGQQAGRALKSALADLASPTANITKKFKELNIDLNKVNPTTNDFASIIDELAKSGATTADIIDAFGKVAGPQIAVLVQKGADSIRDYTEAVTATNAAAEAYAIQNDTLQGSIDILKSKAEGLAIAFFGELEPGMRKVIDSFVNFIEKSTPLLTFFGKIINTVFELATGPLDLLANSIGFLSEIFKEAKTDFELTNIALKDVRDAIKEAGEIENTVNKLNDLTDEYEDLTAKSKLTEQEQQRLKTVIQRIEEIVPNAETSFDKYGNAIETTGDKARAAAKQMLVARQAILRQSQANLENLVPSLELTLQLREKELEVLRSQENASKAYETRLTGQFFALLELRDALTEIATAEAGFGVETGRSLNRTTEAINRYRVTLKALGVEKSPFDQLVRSGATAIKSLELINKLFPQIENNFESFRQAASKRAEIAIEIEDVRQKLNEIADLENQLKVLQGEIEDLDKIDPVAEIAPEKVSALQKAINAFWESFQSDIDKATAQARIFGEEQDVLKSKIDFLRNAYLDLLNKGLDPTSDTLTKIKNLYDESVQALDSLIQKQKEEEEQTAKLLEANTKIVEITEDYKEKLEELGKTEEELRELERQRAIEQVEASGASVEAINAAKDAINEYFDVLSDEEPLEKFKLFSLETFEAILEGAQDLTSSLTSLFDQLTQNRLDQLDRELEAELERQGIAEETTLERIERELQEAIEAGNQERIAELTIQKQREQATLEFEKKKAEAEYQGALASWGFSLLNATAKLAEAIIVATASTAFPANLPAIAFAVAQGANLATVALQKPQPPTFANSGIVPGTSFRGDQVDAKVNSGEIILDRGVQQNLLDMLKTGPTGNNNTPIQLTVIYQVDAIEIARQTAEVFNDSVVTLKPDRAFR